MTGYANVNWSSLILKFWNFKKVVAAIQQPFPALTCLHLSFVAEMMPILPASFLGGSSLGLQELCLAHVPLPELPNLLLSTTHLVNLRLWDIPSAGYISPETIVTCLSVLTRLETLDIRFELYPSKNRRPPPPTRTLLPVLTRLRFKGFDAYLEDFVPRIDAPLPNEFRITFFHQLISDTAQLAQSISHTPKFKTHIEAYVVVDTEVISVTLPQTFHGALQLKILLDHLEESNQHLSYLLEVCSSSLPLSHGGTPLHPLWYDVG